MRKWIWRILIVVILIAVYLLVYLLPVTRPYFLSGEQIELHYIIKTTLHVPEGTTVERYGPVDFSDEDVLENVDVQALIAQLPDMRVTVFKEYTYSRWVGDVTYEISGFIKSGLRNGTHFHIDLGIPEESHLRINGRQWAFRIVDSQEWVQRIAELEKTSS